MDTGLYTIDPFDSFAGPARQTDGYDALVTIAGLGGTGAFLAEDLARLLSVHFGWRVTFILPTMTASRSRTRSARPFRIETGTTTKPRSSPSGWSASFRSK